MEFFPSSNDEKIQKKRLVQRPCGICSGRGKRDGGSLSEGVKVLLLNAIKLNPLRGHALRNNFFDSLVCFCNATTLPLTGVFWRLDGRASAAGDASSAAFRLEPRSIVDYEKIFDQFAGVQKCIYVRYKY